MLRSADQICHLWQRYTSTALFPLAGSAAALRREMSTFNSHNIVRMEGRINGVIQKALDSECGVLDLGCRHELRGGIGIVNWLGYLLTKQKKNDYRPKNDERSFARKNTEPCELCCEFLDTVRDTAREGLSGKNAEAFLTEVGVAFHR